MSVLSQFAQTYNYNYSNGGVASGSDVVRLYAYAAPFGLLALIGMWKMFSKAGRPGWAAIIPVYNLWVLFEISGKPGWWAILSFIPFINIIGLVLYILAMVELSKRFGKGGAFALILVFFPFIGYLVLGFGSATYSAGDGDLPAGPNSTPLV
jgi:hypothetical protein